MSARRRGERLVAATCGAPRRRSHHRTEPACDCHVTHTPRSALTSAVMDIADTTSQAATKGPPARASRGCCWCSAWPS
jgi:hypothetical protein